MQDKSISCSPAAAALTRTRSREASGRCDGPYEWHAYGPSIRLGRLTGTVERELARPEAVERAAVADLPGESADRVADLLRATTVRAGDFRKISRRQLVEIHDRQLRLQAAPDLPVQDPLSRILANRRSYRGPLRSLTMTDVAAILSLSRQTPGYRPFPAPGALRVVSLALRLETGLHVVHLGETDPPELRPVHDEGMKGFLDRSFALRPEIPYDTPSFVAVGIDMWPLLVKYGEMGVGLAIAVTGCVLQLLETVAAHLGLLCVTLYGQHELVFWKIGQRRNTIFPAAVRVGRTPS